MKTILLILFACLCSSSLAQSGKKKYSEVALHAVAFASQEPAFTAEELGVSNKFTFGQVVMEAIKGSPESIDKVFKVADHTDGAGSEFISTAILAILETAGDRKFSNLLKLRSKESQNKILGLLDFALLGYKRSWLRYPKTNSLRKV